MSLEHIVNAWRDEEYRENLSAEDLAHLPESPIGESDLSDLALAEVEGGTTDVGCVITTAIIGFSYFACLSLVNHGTCQGC